jgi:glutathione S-transferase
MQLFYSRGACSLASHIALEEAGADYEAIRVDLRASEQTRPEFLALNPKGRVPALVTPQGVLTETPAILIYVAQTHPAARLAPLSDPFALARLQAFNSYLCSTVHPAFSHSRRGNRWADEEASLADMARKAPSVFGACFDLIEAEMLAGPWVMGETYSVADPYLFTLSGWLSELGLDIGRYRKVAAHHAAMMARPAVGAVLAREAA